MEESNSRDEINSNTYLTSHIHKAVFVILGLFILGLIITIAYLLGRQSVQPKNVNTSPRPSPGNYKPYEPERNPTKPDITTSDVPTGVPNTVDAKYWEIEPTYKDSLGAGIRYCSNGTHEMYQVWGSGGYTGVSYYYELDGTYIGEETFTDVLTDEDPKSKTQGINIYEYNCLDMRVSEGAPIPPPDTLPKPTRIPITGDVYPPIP